MTELLRRALAALKGERDRDATIVEIQAQLQRIAHPGVGSYTEQDQAFIRANVGTMPYAEIGRHVNRPPESVKTWGKKRGLSGCRNLWSADEIEILLRDGPRVASKKTGRSYDSCRIKLRGLRK